jgi:PAS domain S-box-containing protein
VASSGVTALGRAVMVLLDTRTMGDSTTYRKEAEAQARPLREKRSLREAEGRTLEALRESEEYYRTLVQNAPEAIVLLDADKGTFVDCNDNATRLFRLSREELLRHGPAELSPPRQPDGQPSEIASGQKVESALQGETPCFEWVHCNSQGKEILCEVHLVRLPSAAHRLVQGSIVDITERKRSEAALRASEARYRGLVNNATYGIYWVTPESKLLDVNPALVRMLGYDSAEDLLAVEYSRALYCDPAVRDKVHANYVRTGRVDATVEWKRKDGKTISVRINGWQTIDPERGTCIEVIAEDVTERLGLEKQLVQAQKFEAIGQLAGGIAHDFNNMIGAILGWAELGMDETDTGSRLHRHFQKVRQQADRAAALTRQLLAFARRQILEPRNIDLNQTAVETLSLLEKVIGSNIEIKAKLVPDLAVVRADPIHMEQVLMNLCINARDAMPEGGSLIVETTNIAIDDQFCALQPLARPGDYAMLSVTDTGTGMDAATLDRIFEPFFTTKEIGKGTGLGLATVYGIVRQHGGFLHVHSEPGVGSTFRVYIPVSAALEASPAPGKNTPPINGGSETLLVAEDHEGLRQLAQETLVGLGYIVVLAADGEQALQEFRSHRDRIDLALLDVVLPKLSGPEVYARIHEEKPDLPVVFATGYNPDIALLQKVQQQGLPVLQKPYSPRDLARKVREALDQSARLIAHK